MKRTIIITILILLSLLLLTSCQDNTFTYNNPAAISIEILNEDISASDVTVRTSTDSEVERTGKLINISQSQLLRTVVTLSVEGYISQTVIVKSVDFNENGEYSASVTFEETYISLELTIITEAPSDEIEITSNNLLSYKSEGNIYDIKLSKNGTPQVNISAGEDYQQYSITLSEIEINKGISSRTIMLLDHNHTMVILNLPTSFDVYYHLDPYERINEWKKGNQVLYAVQNNTNVTFFISDTQHAYIGEKTITPNDLSTQDVIVLDMNDLDINVSLAISPYHYNSINEFWFVIAEKVDDQFIPISGHYSNWHSGYTNSLFSQNKDYYVFAIGEDGKIRYKEIDIDNASEHSYCCRNIELEFDSQDPIQEITVEIIDFNGGLSDFTGVEIRDEYNSLATITSGNSVDINPTRIFSYLTLENLPDGYEYYMVESLYMQAEEFFFDLAIEGVYKAYIYQPFSLTIHIDSTNNYEGYYCDDYNSGNRYYVDNNNTITIDDYNFNIGYSLSDGSNYPWQFSDKTRELKISDITIDGGNYYATIVFDEYY